MKKILKLIFISLLLLFTSTPINLLHAETLTTQDQSVEVDNENKSEESKSSKVVNPTPTQTTARAITELTAQTKWPTSFFISGANEVIATKTPADSTDNVTWKVTKKHTNVSFKNPKSPRTNITVDIPPNMQELNSSFELPGFEYEFEITADNNPSVKAKTGLIFGGLKAQATVVGDTHTISPDEEAFKNFINYVKTLSNATVTYEWKTYKASDTVFWFPQPSWEARAQGYGTLTGNVNISNPEIPKLVVTPGTVNEGYGGPQNTRVKIEFKVKSSNAADQNISSNLALVKVDSNFPELISVPEFTFAVPISEYNQTDQQLMLENLPQIDSGGSSTKNNYLTLLNKSNYKFKVENKMTVFNPISNATALPSDLFITFKQGDYSKFNDLKTGESYQHVFCQVCIGNHGVSPVDNEWKFNMLGKNSMLVIPANRNALPIGDELNYRAVLDWVTTVGDPISKSL